MFAFSILAIFFFSGLCGLVYEIVWLRMLGLVFGTTVYAASTVVAAFMAGLALGNYFFGRYSDRTGSSLLRAYAFQEAGIGISAMLVPVALDGLSHSFGWLSNALPPLLFFVVRFCVVFLVLLIPTTFMGGTLPVLSKFLIREIKNVGRNSGLLYGINTAGAVAGCLLCGFVFINFLGMRVTVFLAAAVNCVLAACAWMLSARPDPRPAIRDLFPHETAPNGALSTREAYLVLGMFALSGFCALSYEVLWTRFLVFLFSSTVYGYAILLGTFLLGVTSGSLVMASIIDKRKRPGLLFGLIEAGIGLLTASSLLFYPHASDVLTAVESLSQAGLHIAPWNSWLLARACVALLIIFPPTFLFGATFPVVNRLCVRSIPTLGMRIGSAYSVNTIGAVLGSLCTGFALIPLLGIQASVFCIALLNVIIGIVLVLSQRSVSRVVAGTVCLVAMLAVVLLQRNINFVKPLLFFGTTYTKQEKRNLNVEAYKEDPGATVSVLKTQSQGRVLNIDGFNTAGTYGYEYMRMLGHLPMLLHPSTPQKALVICFGTGTTAGTLGLYHPDRIDCAEISRAVMDLAPYFREVNHDIVHSGNFRLIINDGRNHLLSTKEKYDIITLEPMHPYLSSAVNLYSYDFYRLCYARLNDDGVLCQWIPMHVMTAADHRALVKTFALVFPHTTVWFVNTESILIGAKKRLTIDVAGLRKKLSDPGVSRDLSQIGLANMYSLLNTFVLGEAGVKAYTAPVRSIVTDNHPLIEFSAPKALVYAASKGWTKNVEQLTDCIEPVMPICVNVTAEEKGTMDHYFKNNESIYLGRMYQAQGNYDMAIAKYSAALAFNPQDDAVRYCITKIDDDLRNYYKMLGDQCARNGLYDMAQDFYRKALAIDSQSVRLPMGVK
jgi:spermidine synthase